MSRVIESSLVKMPSLAAIVVSELLDKTVIVSTATVALQEQLFHKDLPRLAEIVPELRFDIIKGPGRYVCEGRLESTVNEEAQATLLGEEFQDAFAGAHWQAKGSPRTACNCGLLKRARMRWFKDVAKKLRAGKWDGDIDSLEQQPDPEDWRQVQANGECLQRWAVRVLQDLRVFQSPPPCRHRHHSSRQPRAHSRHPANRQPLMADVCPLPWVLQRATARKVDRRLQGDEFVAVDVADGSGA